MDLVEMLSTLWRTKWIILIVAIVVAGIVGYSTYQKDEIFIANAKLVVGSLGSTSSLGRIGGEDQLAASYSELIQVTDVLQRAVDESGLKMSAAQLRGHVSASTAKGSPYINLQGADLNAQAAIDEVNAVAKGFSVYLADRQKKNVEQSKQEIIRQLTDLTNEQNAIRALPAPDEARLTALNDVRAELLKQFQQIDLDAGGNKVEIVSMATDASADPTHLWRNTIIGFFIGLLGGIGIGFATESVRNALSQEAD